MTQVDEDGIHIYFSHKHLCEQLNLSSSFWDWSWEECNYRVHPLECAVCLLSEHEGKLYYIINKCIFHGVGSRDKSEAR